MELHEINIEPSDMVIIVTALEILHHNYRKTGNTAIADRTKELHAFFVSMMPEGTDLKQYLF